MNSAKKKRLRAEVLAIITPRPPRGREGGVGRTKKQAKSKIEKLRKHQKDILTPRLYLHGLVMGAQNIPCQIRLLSKFIQFTQLAAVASIPVARVPGGRYAVLICSGGRSGFLFLSPKRALRDRFRVHRGCCRHSCPPP